LPRKPDGANLWPDILTHTTMIHHRTLAGAAALGLAALLVSAHAQAGAPAQPQPAASAPSDASDSGAWVLGRGYVQLDGSIDKFRRIPGSSTGAIPQAAVNVPLGDNFDYSASYAYEHATSSGYHLNDNTLENDLTGYVKLGGVAPFAAVGFGYDWERTTKLGVASSYDRPFVNLATGLEVPVSDTTSIRATIGNDDSFKKPQQGDLTYGLSANAWLNSALGTYVGADLKQGYGQQRSSVLYTAGFRIQFE
jgi:hypothetical protein